MPVPLPRELDRTRRRSKCDVRPLGHHRGGSQRHDTCADTQPPNVFPGSDALVTTPTKRSKAFDALSPSNELWEVKTGADRGGDFSANPEFVQRKQLENDIIDITQERSIAKECGHPYVFAVSDPMRLSALERRVSGVIFRLVNC